jgi:hypothetical protein
MTGLQKRLLEIDLPEISEAMSVQEILRLPICQLNLHHVQIRTVIKDYERFMFGKRNLVPSYNLIVSDYTTAHGDWPHGMLQGHAYDNSERSSLKTMRKVLLSLGMTAYDWPMLGLNREAIYQAHIKRCQGNKNFLKKLPVIVMGVSHIKMYTRLGVKIDTNVDNVMTIEDVLAIDGLDQNFLKYQNNDVSCRAFLFMIKEKLRELGFSDADGVFLQSKIT